MRSNIIRILFLTLFTLVKTQAQQNQLLYNFGNVPQTSLLNPSKQFKHKMYIGVPLLSGISVSAGITGITLKDLFLKDKVHFTTKVTEAISKLSSRDFISLNAQINVLNVGYKLDEQTFLTGGFYSEIDFFIKFPKDIATLMHHGNASYLNRNFSFSEIALKGDVLGIFHAGVSRKISKKLNVGGRFKIYSSTLNVYSGKNKGAFSTYEGTNNLLKHYLNNAYVVGKSSGLLKSKDKPEVNISTLTSTFFGGNLGIGIDLGFTYKFSDQTEFLASLLDIGFISYSKDVRNYTIEGNFVTEGINFLYDAVNPKDYWKELEDDFNRQVSGEEDRQSYTLWRPLKLFTSLKHGFGRARFTKNCSQIGYKDYYKHYVGAQLSSVTRPNNNQLAVTTFYERRFAENTLAKIAYTIDEFSYTNIGVGFSTQIGMVNVHALVNNVFKLKDVSNTNTLSIQFGINLIFD